MRADRGRMIAALMAWLGDFKLAEDALQEAAVSALAQWGKSGIPQSPRGWLLTVARRKALDMMRREKRAGAYRADLIAEGDVSDDPEDVPDARLRLIFVCCHPALEPKTRIALTLRSVCGLSAGEIARAFLDTESAMNQRLTRARRKIALAGIPFQVPQLEELPQRIDAVLDVIYLVYTTGYTAGGVLKLTQEAIFLARLLVGLCPDQPEIEGCLALLLLTEGRSAARVDRHGATVPPALQDRSLWDHPMLAEGRSLVLRALSRGAPGAFQIKAAIAACHTETPPDWPQIRALYETLRRVEDTAVVRLNLAVAVAEMGDVRDALRRVHMLRGDLEGFQPFHAVEADLLARDGQIQEADAAYGHAIALAQTHADVTFLIGRRARLRIDTA